MATRPIFDTQSASGIEQSFDALDADLVNAIERELSPGADASDESTNEDCKDRRLAERYSYACVQLVAPMRDDRLPIQSEFQHVLCQDISVGGFSFLCETYPDFERLVVALGVVPFRFVEARVIRVVPIGTGQTKHVRVACRFERQIHGA